MTFLHVQSIPMPGGFAEIKKKYGKVHLGINRSVLFVRCPNNCSCIYVPLCPEGVRRFLAAESDCYVYLAVYCQPGKQEKMCQWRVDVGPLSRLWACIKTTLGHWLVFAARTKQFFVQVWSVIICALATSTWCFQQT